MKKSNRIIAIALAALLMGTLLAACAKVEETEIYDPEDIVLENLDEGDIIDFAFFASEMVPLTASPAVFTIPVPAQGNLVNTNAKATIDYSNTADGYVMIKFLQTTNKELRVIIRGPSSVQYQYRLNQNRQFEVFPLSDGNGSYTIGVFG